ncbi:MAG: ATP-dependent metallopeptidase FtsH/Yme1/Tma family protein [Chloroflexi bacterium]|nr:ATP-dependent metallopeptidase FtsH/Yme1/Tma family protein [Chloroflexota bacterium]
MNPRTRNLFIYLFIGLIITAVFFSVSTETGAPEAITFTELVSRVRNGDVNTIEVVGNQLNITGRNGERAVTNKSPEATAQEQLLQFGINQAEIDAITWEFAQPSNLPSLGFNLLTILLPFLLIGGLIFFMLRQTQGANNQAMAFGKSRARMFDSSHPNVTFDDVAGANEAKEDLVEVVDFLKEPEKFVQLGARIPKGVLLIGSPGTGKTLLAKAVAGEAAVPFFSISGSEFVEMFVGVGASRVRDLFDQAKRSSPCILFIDEIDAVGRQRGAGLGGSHDEREQTLNQILVEMDGFDTDTNIIVLAATNRPDILDPALMRPGRFDRRVILDRPDVKGREEILKVHVRGKPLASDVDLKVMARATPGFVGADLENMVNEAAILAARKNKKAINSGDFHEAIERVLMGPERRSRVITAEERRLTAYHEAGHALAGYLLPNSDPVNKVTIIPRGMSGGSTLFLPDEDLSYISRSRMKSQLVIALAGRVAEEIVFDEVTTGASSDLERVTKIARSMVTRFGMSEKLGPMIFGQKEEMIFLGREISEQRDYSEAVAEEIDAEVRQLVNAAYEEARRLLTEHRAKLDILAARLLEVETLEGEEFAALLDGVPSAVSNPSDPPQGKNNSADHNRPASSDEESGSQPLGPAHSPA